MQSGTTAEMVFSIPELIALRVLPRHATAGRRHSDRDAGWRRDRPQSPSLHEAGRLAHYAGRRVG